MNKLTPEKLKLIFINLSDEISKGDLFYLIKMLLFLIVVS